MGASKYLELAVILKAVDQMSGTVRNALGGATNGYSQLANSKERADASMKKGLVMGAGAKVVIDGLTDIAKKYGNVQEAQQDLRVSMLKPGGGIDEGMFARYTKLSERLSAKYAGTQMDYIDMIRGMRENKLEGGDILGGTGEAVAELSELLKTMPSESAIFAARMKNDMKVPANEMIKMVDLVARLKQVGVGHTGSETINNLTEFYSKAGLGATNLGLRGTRDAMELGALGGMYIAKGQDAPSVGTTFRRIFDNISIPKKFNEMNAEAAKFGKHLVFFDKAGRFKGMQNFVAQLSTLKGLSTSQVSQILGPAGSAQGMSGDVLKSIALYGKEDYQDFLHRISDQAEITQKVVEQQKGLNQQAKITSSNIDNLVANVGKSYNPVVTEATTLTGRWANSLSEFIGNHQTGTGIAAGVLGIAGSALALGSAIHFIGSMWTYSKIPVMLSTIAGSSAWAALTTGAEGFAYALLHGVGPALAGIGEGLIGLLASASGLAALAAAPVALAMYQANYGSASKFLAEAAKYEKGYVPISDDIKNEYYRGAKKPVEIKQSPNMIKLNDMLRNDPVMRRDNNNGNKPVKVQPVSVPDNKPTTIHYNPVVHVSTDADVSKLKPILNEHAKSLMDLINKHKADNLRTAF